MMRRPPRSPLFPSTPLFRSIGRRAGLRVGVERPLGHRVPGHENKVRAVLPPRPLPQPALVLRGEVGLVRWRGDRKSTRLNSSHANISYAVFCLKKKKQKLLLIGIDIVLGNVLIRGRLHAHSFRTADR